MKRFAAIFLVVAAVLLLGLWLARTYVAVQFARSYFSSHGVTSSVEIGELGLAGVSGRFALGPAATPDISAEHVELIFDPLRWLPYVTEVRLVHPVVRAQVDQSGKVTLGSLQDWIDGLSRQQGKSRFVSDDLAVSLRGLRLLLATPGGRLELGGDVRLVKNLPVTMTLRAQPARIVYQDMDISLRDARLAYDQKAGTLAAQLSGDLRNPAMEVKGLDAKADVTGFRWTSAGGQISIAAPAVSLRVAASRAGPSLSAPRLEATVRNLALTSANGKLEGAADLATTVEVGLTIEALTALKSTDPALANALRQNLEHLSVNLAGHAEQRAGVTKFALAQPLMIAGAKGGRLQLSALDLSGTSDGVNATLGGDFKGPGLPTAKLTVNKLLWSGGGFTSDATLSARFDFAMLHGADLGGRGTFSWQNGQYAFTPSGCVRLSLSAFRPGASDLARNVRSDICAPPNQPLLTGEGIGWTLTGEARDASADLPLATAHLEKVAARLAFDGEGAPLKGTATITAGQVSDRAASLRFKPLMASGNAALANGIWRGRFAVNDPRNASLGEATFMHTMATGAGSAHINAPKITFTAEGAQPADLSPLLVALRRSEGTVSLTGDIEWTREAITSRGKLSIISLDFMTPLGKAHAVKSDIVLTSLLPPVTAAGQELTISRIDWTLPFSAVDLRFSFSPTAIHLDKADTDIAQGHATLGALTIAIADPGHVAGAAEIKGITLNSLIAASNLGNKVKMEGKVSGHIPFALTPEGFRITNGRIAADGPGRLSVDRSLWTQGEAAISSNAVQGFAYQALENLAFDQMTAELNSVANGRLQIVFRIKGKSDPPKPQTADVAITDILNGTALYKPVPLPSGTPIDLTLDTSLNFDELLKSYAQAWSKSLSPEGQPDVASGAKP